jgi:hypothetical protein
VSNLFLIMHQATNIGQPMGILLWRDLTMPEKEDIDHLR